METVRPCGCKGIRSCLLCEKEYNIQKLDPKIQFQDCPSYVYCPYCDLSWPGWNIDLYKPHPNHEGEAINFPGIYIQPDFLTEQEAATLIQELDKLPWEISQSGRRKQNFGPKCNFKKKKLRLGTFHGFPSSTRFIQDRFKDVKILKDFQTVEQCSLEYSPDRGASIDPHIDDCWIWGERIVTVNVLGDSVLTMLPYKGSDNRYNLESVKEYNEKWIHEDTQNEGQEVVVRLPMPERSLMVIFGEARYRWEHAVLREDVRSRRVCLAYRELTPPYLINSVDNKEVSGILQQAGNFF